MKFPAPGWNPMREKIAPVEIWDALQLKQRRVETQR